MNDAVISRALDAERQASDELDRIPEWLWEGVTLPVPIEVLADSHYGLLVREHDDLCDLLSLTEPGHVSGLLMPATREIWIDAGEAERAPNRRRFTIGHELGHWVLHCDSGQRHSGEDDTVHCRDVTVREQGAVDDEDGRSFLSDFADYPPNELEANQFGAALLMPAPLVRLARKRWRDDLPDLAREFGVSTMAMEKRLWFLDEIAG